MTTLFVLGGFVPVDPDHPPIGTWPLPVSAGDEPGGACLTCV
ncbi:hypothetical protein [Actinoplanes sp. N902-109]|nr:hypothetical protein [Actinoplanes sp. N902-109]AGL14277.1 hypothetical protein L083_0767 [Actinoplanes sp. N902-109]